VFASITDQCGRLVELPLRPQRIISLVPSQTELLYDLSLEDQLVGITRFCVHPKQALEEKRVVGGTKKIVQKRIQELHPDLIICNKEENTKDIVDFCETVAPTYVSDISSLEDALEMIMQIGTLTGKFKKAEQLKQDIATSFDGLSNSSSNSGSKLKALYLIWKNPYMTLGSHTFIHDMMEKSGFENVMKDQQRYPQIEMQHILDLQPDVILLSSEPYNFKEADELEMCSAFAKAGKKVPKCIIVDGELFSWYGSRLLQSPAYFKELRKLL
jgi:ABC-type Fe3+-hydroxamate transport system substrate-binding protein